MPTVASGRKAAKVERLQAHAVKGLPDTYEVFNVSKGTSYIVRKQGGFWVCECPWFRKRSGTESGPCKHVVRVQDKTAKCSSGCEDSIGVRCVNGEYLCKRCQYIERFRD
jgi:hypothetical protein